MGNLTRDPELKHLESGMAVCSFGIAMNRKFGDKEETTFVDVTMWDKQADTVAKFFTKGKPILIEGRLKLDQWVDKKTGENRSKLCVIGERFTFLPGGVDSPVPSSNGSAPAGVLGDDAFGNPPF